MDTVWIRLQKLASEEKCYMFGPTGVIGFEQGPTDETVKLFFSDGSTEIVKSTLNGIFEAIGRIRKTHTKTVTKRRPIKKRTKK